MKTFSHNKWYSLTPVRRIGPDIVRHRTVPGCVLFVVSCFPTPGSTARLTLRDAWLPRHFGDSIVSLKPWSPDAPFRSYAGGARPRLKARGLTAASSGLRALRDGLGLSAPIEPVPSCFCWLFIVSVLAIPRFVKRPVSHSPLSAHCESGLPRESGFYLFLQIPMTPAEKESLATSVPKEVYLRVEHVGWFGRFSKPKYLNLTQMLYTMNNADIAATVNHTPGLFLRHHITRNEQQQLQKRTRARRILKAVYGSRRDALPSVWYDAATFACLVIGITSQFVT